MAVFLVNVLRVASWVFLARAIFSWFRPRPQSLMFQVAKIVDRVTEPVLAPVRRIIPRVGGVDLSVIAVLLTISFVLIPIVSGF